MSFPTSEIKGAPAAKKIPHASQVHGLTLTDNYHWLRERGNPEVIAYLEAENAYTEAVMAPTQPLQQKLYDEMVGRIKETDLSVPIKKGDYFYYSRTEKGKQYPIFCRKPRSLEAPEEIMLDMNALADGHAYFSLGVLEVSPDHRLLAYSTDVLGNEVHMLYIKDLATGRLLPEIIPDTATALEWAEDNKTFFYTTLDASKRPYKLFRHRLGEEPGRDLEIHHERDEAFFVNIGKTKDRKFLVLGIESKTTSEMHLLDASNPSGKFRMVHPRKAELEYSVEHYNGRLLILTNDAGAKNFKLMEAPASAPEKKNWKEFLPYRPEIKIDGLDVFRDFLVLYLRERGLTKIRVRRWDGTGEHDIEFPEPVYTVWGGSNPEFESETLRFGFSSLVTPNSVYDYSMKTRERTLKKQQEVLGGYDPSRYVSERIFAVSHDGTEIPISLVSRKGLARNRENPFLLYGYGAYGISTDPMFSSNRLSLLDRGFGFAIAHIRGGGDLGRPWYDDGKLMKKKNSFLDFIACAQHLVTEGYTRPEKLVISGGSAGGLLMGAVVNLRPDLFAGVVMHVPFVDVSNTMLDETLPLTVTEYDEWGDPHGKEAFDYIHSYSPYDNMKPGHYPAVLITGGLNDPRVQYWEPAKWTAKLRTLKNDPNALLLKINMGAGHGGASGRYDFLKEIALDYAFMFKVLGIGD
ncbi:MAG TPA: S9 family peptidase [Verrucomicrobiae bacterium]|jgi:oligopeptidase B|nr:S9 family peptidase [Verrucomicrobiae bacterium]